MRTKNTTVLSASIVTAACAASLVLSVMPAHADSIQSSGSSVTSTGSLGNHAAPGGAVPRSQVIARAKVWVDEQVPYSANGLESPYSWWADSRTGGRYRQDCSGFVSMAWQLNSSRTTWTLPDVSSQISKWDLQPGDALNSNDHVVLFAGWRDKAAGTFNYYQESSRSRPTSYNTDGNLYASSLASHPTSSYSALRYKNIAADTPPASAASKVHLEIVGADGGMWNTDGDYAAGEWTGSWASLGGTGLKALTSAVTGNTMHVYGIGSTGRVYTKDANYTTGQWTTDWAEIPGTIEGATALTASATGNKVHLEAIGADGAMWNTDGDYTAGGWTGTWTALGGTGLKALTSAVTGNTMHVYAIGSTGRVYTKDANYTTGQWTTDWAEIPGAIEGATALTASVTANTVHLNVIGADSALHATDGDYAAGGWTGTWTALGGSGLKALTSTVTGNTMHVYAIGSTGRVYTKDANYTTGQWTTDWAEIPGNGSGATALTASTTQ